MRLGTSKRICLLVALTVTLLRPAAGSALTLAAVSVEEMLTSADAVVRARCIDRYPTRGPNGRIESRARFEVLMRGKGETPDVVVVQQLGGSLNDLETTVPGAPLSEAGDEAVLFLEHVDADEYRVVATALGYLPVAPGAFGRPMVRVPRRVAGTAMTARLEPLDEVLPWLRGLAQRDAGAE